VSPTTTFTRRNFLFGGSVLVASTWLLGPTRTMGRLDPFAQLEAQAQGQRLSVGYLEGSAGLTAQQVRELIGAGGARVVPAASLRAGDRALVGRTAKVTVHGPSAGTKADLGSGIRAVELDALVAAPGGVRTDPLVPFYAWTQIVRPQPKASSPASLRVGVDPRASLALALRVKRDDGTQDLSAVTVFTGGRDGNLAKLKQGAYVVALDESTWDAPVVLPAGGGKATGSLLMSVGRFQ
jgi:hypothetical protein